MSATAEIAKAVIEQAPVTKTVPLNGGYSPTFWGIVVLIITVAGSNLRGWIKGLPDRTRAQTEQDEAEATSAAAATKQVIDTLMSEIGALRSRVTEVEKQVVDERAACVRQMTEMATRHAGEMESMRTDHRREMDEIRGELRGARENVIQRVRSSGDLMEIGRRFAPETIARLEKDGE